MTIKKLELKNSVVHESGKGKIFNGRLKMNIELKLDQD